MQAAPIVPPFPAADAVPVTSTMSSPSGRDDRWATRSICRAASTLSAAIPRRHHADAGPATLTLRVTKIDSSRLLRCETTPVGRQHLLGRAIAWLTCRSRPDSPATTARRAALEAQIRALTQAPVAGADAVSDKRTVDKRPTPKTPLPPFLR